MNSFNRSRLQNVYIDWLCRVKCPIGNVSALDIKSKYVTDNLSVYWNLHITPLEICMFLWYRFLHEFEILMSIKRNKTICFYIAEMKWMLASKYKYFYNNRHRWKRILVCKHIVPFCISLYLYIGHLGNIFHQNSHFLQLRYFCI